MNPTELAAVLREHRSRHSIPGAAIGIIQNGRTVTAYDGMADVERGRAVTAETRFSPGSLTKPMVATVIAHLAEAGELSLDDPVAAHVPELRRPEGWASRAAVRDLLANSSRLPLRAALEFGFDSHPDEDDAALARLTAEVGEDDGTAEFWSYTNVGWCVLGRVIETVTGTPWEAAMQRHLFDSIGMDGTTYATASDPKGRASGYTIAAGGSVRIEPEGSRAYGPAGTRVVSTVTDLLRFAGLHLEDPSLAFLRNEQARISISGWLDSWCLGWARFDWGGGPVWGWDGLIGGERSCLRFVPDRRAAIVLLTNGSSGRAMYRSLFADLMPRLFDIRVPAPRLDPVPGVAGDLSRFAGRYAWPDQVVDISATPAGLVIGSDDGEKEAFPVSERSFLVDSADPDNPTITFGAFDANGRPQVLYDMLWGLPRVS